MTVMEPFNVPRLFKLRVEDFLLLDRAGAFDANAKTELIEGKIYGMNAQFRRHGYVQTELLLRLSEALRTLGGLKALVEVSVSIPPRDMPEPDITVTREPLGEGPIPLASVALVVEVADTTRDIDLGRKAALYARHDVPEYWVADLETGSMHQLWQPVGKEYAKHETSTFGERITAATLAGLSIETNALT